MEKHTKVAFVGFVLSEEPPSYSVATLSNGGLLYYIFSDCSTMEVMREHPQVYNVCVEFSH